MDKLDFMIDCLLRERPSYAGRNLPVEITEKKRLLRALINTRPPEPADALFLQAQNFYLQEELAGKNIVNAADLPLAGPDPRLALWRGDITTLKADAIVNAANSALLGCFMPGHLCIDNVIHTAAGIQLRLECNKIMKRQGHDEPVGQAKITPGYNLPASYVLHTVGPNITGPLTEEHRQSLASCYRSCLSLAAEYKLKTLAFCCISTGEYKFPRKEAAKIAVDAVKNFTQNETSLEKVVFNVFNEQDFLAYNELLAPSA